MSAAENEEIVVKKRKRSAQQKAAGVWHLNEGEGGVK